MYREKILIVDAFSEGKRLDQFIKKKFVEISFNNIQKLIRLGKFKVDDKKKNLITKLKKIKK